MQSLRNNFFGHVRAVGIRSVDEINSQLYRAPHDSDRLRPIRRLAPNSFAGQAHGTKSEPGHSQVIANEEFPGFPRNPDTGWRAEVSFSIFRLVLSRMQLSMGGCIQNLALRRGGMRCCGYPMLGL